MQMLKHKGFEQSAEHHYINANVFVCTVYMGNQFGGGQYTARGKDIQPYYLHYVATPTPISIILIWFIIRAHISWRKSRWLNKKALMQHLKCSTSLWRTDGKSWRSRATEPSSMGLNPIKSELQSAKRDRLPVVFQQVTINVKADNNDSQERDSILTKLW